MATERLDTNPNEAPVESIFTVADYDALCDRAYQKQCLLVISFEPEATVLRDLCCQSNRYLTHGQLTRLASSYLNKGIVFATCNPSINEDTAKACSVNVSHTQVIHFYREGNVMVDRIVVDTCGSNEVYGMVDEICQRYAKKSCCAIL